MSKLKTGNKKEVVKVVFVISSLSQKAGGTALEVVNLAAALSENSSFHITVMTLQNNGPHYGMPSSVKLLKFDMKSPQSLYRNLCLYRKALNTADIILMTGIWGFFDGLLFRFLRPAGIPFYIRVCGMLEKYILERNRYKKRPAEFIYVNNNLNKAAGLIVNSLPEKLQVENLDVNPNILLIRNWVKPPIQKFDRADARSSLKYNPSDRVLLYLGRIHLKKNLHRLLSVMIKVYSSQSNAPKLLVAGGFSDPDYEKTIKNLFAKARGILDVRYLGEIFGDQKELAFCASDVFILPSESEGLPNAVLEAMVRGLPVAITKGCNLPEVESSKAGICFEANNNGIRDALTWVMTDYSVLVQAGEAARSLALHQFSRETMVSQYTKLILSSKLKT